MADIAKVVNQPTTVNHAQLVGKASIVNTLAELQDYIDSSHHFVDITLAVTNCIAVTQSN